MQYEALHNLQPGYGKTGLRLFPYLKPLLDDQNTKQFLDFGCGKGALGKALQTKGYNVTLYDPYVPEYSAYPEGTFDLVLCTDVMEHVPSEGIHDVLTSVSNLSKRAVFVISLTFADALLPDGTNAHCVIETADWWRQKLREVFPVVIEVPTRQATAVCFVTWQPKPQTLSALRKRKKFDTVKRRFKRNAGRPGRRVLAAWLSRSGLAYLRVIVKDKRVAIVGNARSISDQTHGCSIDQHDVVIRLNRGPILSPEISGTKTDVLATSTWISSGLYDERGVSLLLWLTPKTRDFPEWLINTKRRAAVFPRHMQKQLIADVGERPSSGVLAIEAVMHCQPAEVSVFGYDGFSSRSLSGSQSAQTAPHDFALETKYLDAVSRENPTLSFY